MFDKLLSMLLKEPLILFVVGAWIIGIIGSVVKSAKKARERAEQARQLPSEQVERARPEPVQMPTPVARERSAEEIAREMRRILGVETVPAEAAAGDRSAPESSRGHRRETEARHGDVVDHAENSGSAEPPPLPPTPRRRNVVVPERAPVPVVPSTNRRRLPTQVDPHVGESMQHRVAPQSGRVGGHAAGAEIGNLGGRVHDASSQLEVRGRYTLSDLKRVVVMSEILGRPLSLRSPGEREI